MKPLVYLAHPRLDRSEISGPLFEAARQTEGITCVDLYATYPTFEIDVAREQRRLVDHDAIVFLHPIYWYSAPSIVREWQDLVLEYGFAYGKHGHALDGKVTFNAVSCGALETSYRPGGGNGAHLRDLLMPFEKTADLCRMRYLAPFAIYGAGRAVEEDRRKGHLAAWQGLLTALRDERLDLRAAHAALTLNDIAASHAAKPETA
ncbi:NAD(P)H-dependent oxidoreductase [Tropicimonas sediminicola]|uniref:Kef-type potassium/proton antiporter accessory protein, CPA2 family n=1 Tax=Tropicimonas sediminicola TaxID=1031541 RepID=A0A239L8H4_9RHOB|nr:NAD(P)H-dependent oxidoreductase [Tropicimonas sediminicola]SNT26590.1 Kef-type potassium/proton antiporter accessory protein, CPA2 family [Tropicimonas sediminicola]